MHPILVTPPSARPIEPADVITRVETLADASVGTIGALIDAAVSYLDGWSGVLGRCLVEQTWKIEDDCHSGWFRPYLPFLDVLDVTSVEVDGVALDPGTYTWSRNSMGVLVVPTSPTWPTGKVSIIFTAGYGAPEKVPAAIKQAIVLMVANLYAQTSEDGRSRSFQVEGGFTEAFNSPEQQSSQTMKAVDMLLAPFRRMSV